MSETPPILARVAAGDPDAVDDCVARYGDLVWSLAHRGVPRGVDLEDVVQEIFLDVWKSAGRFDAHIASEVTFIAMIARRRLIDLQRRNRRTPAVESIDVPETVLAPSAAPPAEVADEARLVQRALTRLNDERRRILMMSFGEDCSHERIADRLGMPLGTVKSHARRGLIQLRELLAQAAADTRIAAREGRA